MLAFDRHVCLTRVKPLDVRGERNDLDPVEELVRGVITDDDGGALLSDLAADRRLEVDPPDLTAFHARRPRWWLLPTPVSYTHLRAHETVLDLVCRLLLEKKK